MEFATALAALCNTITLTISDDVDESIAPVLNSTADGLPSDSLAGYVYNSLLHGTSLNAVMVDNNRSDLINDAAPCVHDETAQCSHCRASTSEVP